MKRLGILVLLPGWQAGPSHCYSQHEVRRYPFIHLGRERHCDSRVSCPRTQYNVPGQGSSSDSSIRRQSALTMRLPRYRRVDNLHTNEMSNLKCNNSEWAYRIEDVLNHSQTEFTIHAEWHVVKQSAMLNAPKTKSKLLGVVMTLTGTTLENRINHPQPSWVEGPYGTLSTSQCKHLFCPILRRKKERDWYIYP